MGESKRRKAALGENYGKESKILPWLPITKRQTEGFMKLSSRVTWIGIGTLAALWVTVLFIGPWLGWWQVN